MKVRMLAGAAVLALALAGAGCSGDEYDRGQFVDDLTEDGLMTEQQANCIADGIEDQIDLEKVADQTDLTEEQLTTIQNVTAECMGLGDLGLTEDSVAG